MSTVAWMAMLCLGNLKGKQISLSIYDAVYNIKPYTTDRRGELYHKMLLNVHKTPCKTVLIPGHPNPVWISNYIHYKEWDEITKLFSDLHGCIDEIWEWVLDFISTLHGASHYLFILGSQKIYVFERGARNECDKSKERVNQTESRLNIKTV